MPHLHELRLGSYVEYAGFVDGSPVFCANDGAVSIIDEDTATIEAHEGLLAACISLDHKELLTGGEDGKVLAINQQGDIRLISELPNKWIDTIAAGPQGTVGFATGRSAFVAQRDASLKEFTLERAVEGLCFAPKGMRLALARYNGVSLFWTATDAKPVSLEWAGAHTAVTFSPNGKFVVTTMQENALHGWRLDNSATGGGKHMRMTGYPAKVKSISWSPKGKWLATSGAEAAILWPFSGKDGPMGKSPKELGTRGDTTVSMVACHPTHEVVAIGYGDGMILAVRIEDGQEAVLRKSGTGPISSLNWDIQGLRIAYGSEDGEAGVIDVAG